MTFQMVKKPPMPGSVGYLLFLASWGSWLSALWKTRNPLEKRKSDESTDEKKS